MSYDQVFSWSWLQITNRDHKKTKPKTFFSLTSLGYKREGIIGIDVYLSSIQHENPMDPYMLIADSFEMTLSTLIQDP